MSVFAKLDPFQRDAVDWIDRAIANCGGAGLFAEQGTGKTWITLGYIERLISPTFSALIVVPVTNLESTWAKNLAAELPSLSLVYDWDEFKRLPPPRALIIGYERLSKIIRKVKQFKGWSLVAFDESQRLNKRSSGWSRAARMLRHVDRRLALSGTPLEQAPQDVWAQMRFIDYKTFGESWAPFAGEYMKPGGFMGKKWLFIDRKMPQFLEAIKHCCLRIDQSVLNLPPSHLIKVSFDLFGEQARIYRAMEKDMVVSIKGKDVIAPLKITSMIRTQQICGGYLSTPDGDEVVGQGKMRQLRRLIESGKVKPPFVVFCRFRPEVLAVEQQLLKYFKQVEILWGKTGAGKNKSIIRGELNLRFQKSLIDGLVCQTKTGGVGVDLYTAAHAVIYSTTFSSIDFDQTIKRLVRRGQNKEVSIFFLCARDTIDEDIYLALENKRSVTETFLSRLKQRSINNG